MSNYLTTDTDLASVANAIRAKSGSSGQLAFPQGFVDAVEAIETGGGGSADVFWATYGATTSAEVEAAYQAGKIVLVENNSIVFLLTARISATHHVFTVATSAGTGKVVLNNDAWSTSSKNIPSASNRTPQALGTAAAGSALDFSRADHVHQKPTASDIGAVAAAQGVDHAGEFVVVGSDGNITTVTMSVWQGGSY